MFLDRVPKTRPHDMRVNLGSRDVSMPQHDLYAAQVRSAFQKMSGEAVAQHMRSEPLENSRFLAVPAQELPESLAGQASAARRHEKVLAGTPFEESRPSVPQIFFDRRDRRFAHRH